MPFVNVYIHLVWSTKNREPFLASKKVLQYLCQHILDNAREKNIYVDFINGHLNHCHCLISLKVNQTISKVVQYIKGESSYWINKNNFCDGKFEWQDEYYAASISESLVDKTRDYIKNQEEHHKHRTFEEETNDLIGKYGFQKSYLPSSKDGV